MNLWAKKPGLILLSALIFFSCEEELNTIGLPPENNLGIFFVDIPLNDKVSQFWVDNVNSRGTGVILVGGYQDEYFGLIEAKNFSELSIPSQNPGRNFSGNAQFDSLVLETRIRGLYGTNITATPQIIEIYQLTDTITVRGKPYYTSSSQPVGQKLSESHFFVYPDSVGLKLSDTNLQPDDHSGDSLFVANHFDNNSEYIYRSRFKIENGYEQEFFTKIKNRDPAFSDTKSFADYFKGIAFVPAAGNSAIISYRTTDTRMVLYFTETDSDGKSTQKELIFSLNSNISYNNISPNKSKSWSGSDFDNLNTLYESFTTDTELAYLQSGTNLMLKLDLSSLKELKDTVSNPIIQRAELVFEGLKSVSATTPLPSQMTYYNVSKDNLNQAYIDSIVTAVSPPIVFSNSGSATLVNYVSQDNAFKNDITLFLQNMIQGDRDQLIMAPITINQNGAVSLTSANVNRFVVAKEDIHLRIYYTTPERNN